MTINLIYIISRLLLELIIHCVLRTILIVWFTRHLKLGLGGWSTVVIFYDTILIYQFSVKCSSIIEMTNRIRNNKGNLL